MKIFMQYDILFTILSPNNVPVGFQLVAKLKTHDHELKDKASSLIRHGSKDFKITQDVAS